MNKEEWPKLDVNIKREQGFLYDSQIANALARGKLVVNGDAASAKYACYELHIGDHIQQLVLDNTPGNENDLYKVKRIGDDGVVQIGPGETYKIYAKEQLNMPADVFAISIPVGNMFKLGLNPETTFADPGFSGDFYVTVCNYSQRIVKLKVGDPLARLFFFKLAERPEKIHEGRPREIPPSVERVRRPTEQELLTEGEAKLIHSVMMTTDPPHYQHAFVTQRLFSHHKDQTATKLEAVEREATGKHEALKQECEARLEEIRRKVNAAALLAAVCSLIVFVIGGVAIAGLVASRWPSLSEGVWASLIAAFIWAILIALIGWLTKAIWKSLGASSGKQNDNNHT
jgi:deoxycytidine triphosphate deaminase